MYLGGLFPFYTSGCTWEGYSLVYTSGCASVGYIPVYTSGCTSVGIIPGFIPQVFSHGCYSRVYSSGCSPVCYTRFIPQGVLPCVTSDHAERDIHNEARSASDHAENSTGKTRKPATERSVAQESINLTSPVSLLVDVGHTHPPFHCWSIPLSRAHVTLLISTFRHVRNYHTDESRNVRNKEWAGGENGLRNKPGPKEKQGIMS